MQQAIALANMGVGRTAPNPPVGAIIVSKGQVVGRGFHPKAGEPHAEVFALRDAGEQAKGADIYVTLEPCSHSGRTGPCADALIDAGIAAVYVGCVDPNPQVAGRGIKRLQAAGVQVHVGVCEDACRQLIAPFAKHIQTGLPLTLYKAAMTADGQTGCLSGDSKWVSGEVSREQVHQLRNEVDVIAVGIGTVLADDPALTARCEGGRDPVRLIVDDQLQTPRDAQLVRQAHRARTIIATCEPESHPAAKALRACGVEVWSIATTPDGLVDLPQLWRQIGEAGYYYMLLEGGATLAGAALRAGLIDRLRLYLAPKCLGGLGSPLFAGPGVETMSSAYRLDNLQVHHSGEDLRIEGDVCLPA